VLAAVAFALANTSARLAYQGGSNPLTIAACRFVLPTVALFAWLGMSGVPVVLAKREGLVAVFLGLLTALYSWALLRSLNEIPLGLAVLIFYLFPLIAAVILGICGWERLAWRTGAAILLAFIGLALALDPRHGNLNGEGIALALIAALGLGGLIVISSRLLRATDARVLTFYMAAVAAIALLALCTAQKEFALPQTGLGWIGFIGTAAFYAFAMIAFYVAMPMVGPVRVSLLSYGEPIVATAFGAIVLGETLGPTQIGGVALVILSLIGATARLPFTSAAQPGKPV
jgi:drug/metabolite transporter (DMT)-like permease